MLCGGRRPRHGRCCLVLRSGRAVAPARHVPHRRRPCGLGRHPRRLHPQTPPALRGHLPGRAARHRGRRQLRRRRAARDRARSRQSPRPYGLPTHAHRVRPHPTGTGATTQTRRPSTTSGEIDQGALAPVGTQRPTPPASTRARAAGGTEAGDRRGGDAGTGPAGVGGRAPVRTRESERRRATDDAGHHIRGDDERKVAEQTQRQAAGGCRSESVLVQRGNVAPALREESVSAVGCFPSMVSARISLGCAAGQRAGGCRRGRPGRCRGPSRARQSTCRCSPW